MNTGKKLEMRSQNLQDLLRLARTIGDNLRGGELIELVGDMGAGKTEFVRGLAKGIKSKDTVASPTFTISRVYSGENEKSFLEIHHFDFYRLTEPGLIEEQLKEIINNDKTVAVIEWSNIVSAVLPNNKVTINISPNSLETRDIIIDCPSERKYLLKGLI